MLTLFSGLAIGGAILGGIATVMAVFGNIGMQKEANKQQKDLIDYEYNTLGRRDER